MRKRGLSKTVFWGEVRESSGDGNREINNDCHSCGTDCCGPTKDHASLGCDDADPPSDVHKSTAVRTRISGRRRLLSVAPNVRDTTVHVAPSPTIDASAGTAGRPAKKSPLALGLSDLLNAPFLTRKQYDPRAGGLAARHHVTTPSGCRIRKASLKLQAAQPY